MEKDLKLEIKKKLKQIENMIEKDEEDNKIEKERKKLDEMLKKYLKEI